MSNEDNFVDIEELEDNNPKEINEETNIQTTQEKNKIYVAFPPFGEQKMGYLFHEIQLKKIITLILMMMK